MKIIFSKEAVRNHQNISKYIQAKFGKVALKKYNQAIRIFKRDVKNNPFIGKLFYQNIHCLVINKPLSIFYLVEDEKIIILTFWDNRQNDEKLKKLIS